jgi:hypothetical protein
MTLKSHQLQWLHFLRWVLSSATWIWGLGSNHTWVTYISLHFFIICFSSEEKNLWRADPPFNESYQMPVNIFRDTECGKPWATLASLWHWCKMAQTVRIWNNRGHRLEDLPDLLSIWACGIQTVPHSAFHVNHILSI